MTLRAEQWRERQKPADAIVAVGEAVDPAALIAPDGKAGQFAWNVLARVLTYSAGLIGEVTDSPQDIDDAMKLGYNWIEGPFELLDRIGTGAFIARLEAEGRPVPAFLKAASNARFMR
ncbi:MAG: 3-hydroxyacyl-CoA dehydrogenase family protein [Nitratireductor sp.]